MTTQKYKDMVEQRTRKTLQKWTEQSEVTEKDIYRLLHNLKGTAGTIGLYEVEQCWTEGSLIPKEQWMDHFVEQSNESQEIQLFSTHYHPEQAFDLALKTPFVAIVVDLMLGEELDGWDLIRMLKHDPRTENIPIVISSALDKSDRNLMNDAIQKYLTKPYPPGELSNTLEEIVKIKPRVGEVLFPSSRREMV